MIRKYRIAAAVVGLFMLNRHGLADSVKIPAGADNENTYAHASKISLDKAISIALKQVPGRATWAAMENFDGKLHSMVQVVREDRTGKLVTLDSGSGAVEKIEDVKEKKKKAKDEKKEKKPALSAVKGSLPIGASKPNDWPFAAKISLDQAMKTAVAEHPGKFVEVYLFDKGGFLFYGIEISSAKKQITKVDVDAGNGMIAATENM